MSSVGDAIGESVCGSCGDLQKIEKLGGKALQRQETYLHDRGLARLWAAACKNQEAP